MLLFELGFLPMDARPPRHAIVAEALQGLDVNCMCRRGQFWISPQKLIAVF